MFLLKKILGSLLLPPGIFILAIGAISITMVLRRRWILGLLNLFVGMALWALSTAPVAHFLMRELEAGIYLPRQPTGDVIILLGGGTVDRVPDLTGMAAPSPLMMGRLLAAVRLYQRLTVPIIVSGGRVFDDESVAEARVVKRFLVDLGVPAAAIILETRARDTSQNARLTAAICRQRGFARPILLTAAYHMKRARMAFDAAGMAVNPFPAYYLGPRGMSYAWRHLLPQIGALTASANALHEYAGIWYHRYVEAF
jgi:uncharacterized SAM-binding protein YcdF (DUF218 family)